LQFFSSKFCLGTWPLYLENNRINFKIVLITGHEILFTIDKYTFVEKPTHLQNLLVNELQILYCSEEHLQKVLPKLAKKARHSSLKNMLKHHASLSQDHQEQLEAIIQLLTKQNIPDQSCKGMQGLIDELKSLLEADADEDTVDIVIITGLQKIGSYKICCYGNAKIYASSLNLRKPEKLLQKILEEERDDQVLLNQLMQAILPKQESKVPKGKNMNENKSSEENDENSEEIISNSNDSTENIQSPGGRAGTSHRSYGSGESRGH
jgi:ferritin-like metal-binding protein YciE